MGIKTLDDSSTKVADLAAKVHDLDYSSLLRAYRRTTAHPDLKNASETLLQCMSEVLPRSSALALFLVDHETRRLLPSGSRRSDGRKRAFQISRGVLFQAFRERKTVWRTAEPNGAETGGFLIALPARRAGKVIGLLHIEIFAVEPPIAQRAVEWAGELLELVTPVFELLTLGTSGGENLMASLAQTINASIEAKDTYTSGHSERVGRFSRALGVELGLDENTLKMLHVSAICHDVGKMGVSDLILKKPSLLSAEEFEEIKAHPTIGARIIEGFPSAELILAGVKHHHERWDGTGYPDGLAGDEIPLIARIIAVADAFDAMTSGRSYAGYVEQAQAIEQLVRCTDLYDAQILKALDQSFAAGRFTIRTDTIVGVR